MLLLRLETGELVFQYEVKTPALVVLYQWPPKIEAYVEPAIAHGLYIRPSQAVILERAHIQEMPVLASGSMILHNIYKLLS